MGLPAFDLYHVLDGVLSGRLPTALARQPIIDLRTEAVAGHEVLFRIRGVPDVAPPILWEHAVRSGVLDRLEDHVARACRKQPRGPLPLFVNAHPSSEGIVERWREIPNVVVELCEVAEIRQATVKELRNARIPIALDDVGVGHADLRTLARIIPQFIKADRSLVESCDQSPGRSAVIKSLVCYTDAIGATLIAEGVETRSEARRLMELGVRYAQGFLIGPPEIDWEAGA